MALLLATESTFQQGGQYVYAELFLRPTTNFIPSKAFPLAATTGASGNELRSTSLSLWVNACRKAGWGVREAGWKHK